MQDHARDTRRPLHRERPQPPMCPRARSARGARARGRVLSTPSELASRRSHARTARVAAHRELSCMNFSCFHEKAFHAVKAFRDAPPCKPFAICAHEAPDAPRRPAAPRTSSARPRPPRPPRPEMYPHALLPHSSAAERLCGRMPQSLPKGQQPPPPPLLPSSAPRARGSQGKFGPAFRRLSL